MLLLISVILCVVITLIGGKIAHYFSNTPYRSDILGFSAGAILGVAFFDLLPEAFSVAHFSPEILFFFVLGGFLLFHICERFMHFHSCKNDPQDNHSGHSHNLGSGPVSVIVLCLHSFIDGLMIGVAFLLAAKIGFIILCAILAHRLCDGINIVSAEMSCKMSLNNIPLYINAFAPILGVLFSHFIHIPYLWLPLILAASAGFFIYLGASDLLPASHMEHSNPRVLVFTILGCFIVFLIVKIAVGF